MARRRTATRNFRRAKKKFTLPLAIVAGFIPAGMDIYNNRAEGIPQSVAHTVAGLIGWDTHSGKYVGWFQAKAAGAPGLAIGFGVHYLASKLGINRMIARAGIPLIRI